VSAISAGAYGQFSSNIAATMMIKDNARMRAV